MAARIEDYALIGDCRTSALVGRDGSIDWFCCPRFDSEACFAALLGSREHGRWLISPTAEARITRRYRPNTLILETNFETADGAVTLIDFMPMHGRHSSIVRLVKGIRGKVRMRTELILRFGYGAIVPWVTRMEDGTLRAIAGPDMVLVRTPVHLRGVDMTTVGEFTVDQGETIPFVLNYLPSHRPLDEPFDPARALADTETFWRDWSAKCRPAGPWSEAVKRSMITLKALTYAPTGGMVAAPTTSLPEQLGGERNWDYRFCWLRDATLVLLGAMHAGYFEEAQAWREWLLRAVAGSPRAVADHVRHRRRAAADRMGGRRGCPATRNPRRCASATPPTASFNSTSSARSWTCIIRRGVPACRPTNSGWEAQLAFLDHLKKIWKKPDHGIWENRGEPQHFTHSKVMAWVAFDRAIKSAEMFGLEGPLDEWRKLREEICDEVCARGFDSELGKLRAVLRIKAPRRELVADPLRRLSAGIGSARARHDRGGRKALAARRLRHALRHP